MNKLTMENNMRIKKLIEDKKWLEQEIERRKKTSYQPKYLYENLKRCELAIKETKKLNGEA